MAPPTKKPRLSQIDPDALARKVEHEAIEQLNLLHELVFDKSFRAPSGQSAIHETVRVLAHYARAGDCAPPDLPLLLSRFEPLFDVLPDPWKDPQTPLGLVVGAALARESLERGRPVTPSELGMLAGLSTRQVGELIRTEQLAGELTARDGTGPAAYIVKNSDAKRWLAARGVPGFGRAKKKQHGASR